MKPFLFASAAALLLLTAACSADRSDPAAGPAAAASAAATTGATGFRELAPNERLQGTLTLDFGAGPQIHRSLMQKLADDLGEQADRRMATAQGQSRIDAANEAAAGSGVQITAADISELTHAMAGKTIADSQFTVIRNPAWHVLHLNGKAADGTEAALSIPFSSNTMEPVADHINITIKPADADSFRDYYELDGIELELGRLEQDADGFWSASGRFRTGEIPAADISENLAGRSLPPVDGSFDFSNLPENKI